MKLHHKRYVLGQKIQKTKTRLAIGITAIAMVISGGGMSFMLFGTANAAAPTVVYDSLPSVNPPTNYPSQPFQAQQTSEFGDYVHLAGSARKLHSVTVTMSNWALQETPANAAFCGANATNCDSTGYFWPITVNVYSSSLTNDVPNNLLGSKTILTHIPWRPAGDSSCGSTSNGYGWKVGGTCYDYSGIAFNAGFDLSSLGVNLPDDVIVSFAYNTQSYGQQPTAVDGPYNSLNIAIPENDPVTVGSDNNTDATFWNTTTVSWYTNQNCHGGTLCLDTNWTPYGTIAMQITATGPCPKHVPRDKDDCKNDRWKSFDGMFKNQGQCVSYSSHNDEHGSDRQDTDGGHAHHSLHDSHYVRGRD